MYPFRAVEHRVAIVRAANTGVSAFIAPSGRIARQLHLFDRGVLRDSIPLRRGQTLYTRLGDWFAYACLAVSVLCLGLAMSPRARRSAVVC
jgi:apolipoprotein N-acyltransferase